MLNVITDADSKSKVSTHLGKSILCFLAILISLVFFVSDKVNAQIPTWQWAKGIGGMGDDRFGAATIDASGNVYMMGSFKGTVDMDPGVGVFNLTSEGGSDIFISKSDNSGNFLWAKKIGGTAQDYSFSIKLDNWGNIYCGGVTTGNCDVDPGLGVFNITASNRAWFICKFDNDCNFIWAKAHNTGVDEHETIEVDATGSVYAVGHFWNVTIDFDPGPGTYYLTPAGMQDIYIYKLDSSGNFAWAYGIGAGDTDLGWGVAIDNSGNVYAGGSFSGTVDFDPGPGVNNLTSKGGEDIFVLKLSSAGNFLWARGMGGINTERITGISVDPFGNVVSTGFFEGTVDFDPGVATYNITPTTGWDCFISKLDSSGNFVWAKSNEGGLWFNWYFSDFDAFGNVYVFGDFEGTVDLDPGSGIFNVTSNGGWDAYITKLDVSGNFIWGKKIGGTANEICHTLTCNDAGQAYIALYSNSPSITFDNSTITNKGSQDIFIAKLSNDTITDPCANITCNINPGAFATNVSNAGCNNGTIEVKRGNGVYNFYPHIELYKDANLVTFIDLSPGTLEYTFSNLIPGKYTVKVSDGLCCQITFFRNIKCRAPSSGFQASNVAAQSVDLTWNVVNCAEGYRVQFRPVGTTFWYARNTNGNTGTISITGLLPNTTYEWRVGTKCPGWPTTQNTIAYSPKSSFKTTALRVGEIITETNFTNEAVALNLFPNPATYTLTVNFEGESDMANLKVVNTVGQVVYQKQLSATDGIYEAQLDVSNFSNGMYVLLVETANSISRKNFVKE